MARVWETKINIRYFYGLEKRNYGKKTATKLKLSNGDFSNSNDQCELLQEQMGFSTPEKFEGFWTFCYRTVQ